VVTAFAEIGGGYLVWLWLRDRRKNPVLGVVGGLTLFLYGIIHTSNYPILAGYTPMAVYLW